jgi:hypothetical protein
MINVNPAGANKLGYESDTAPVLIPLIGRMLASALVIIMMINVIAERNTIGLNRFIDSLSLQSKLFRLLYDKYITFRIDKYGGNLTNC